jgi:EmrB/QacA subfamily drug resistance transporter
MAKSKRWWALIALSLSFLVVGLDSYVLTTALPTLSAKLGATTSQLQWITDAYTLAMAALLLPAGKLGDRFGRRKTLLAGLALFGVASIVTSQVDTVGELIAMRAVMGAGAAIIMPLTMSVLPVLFRADADRRRAVAVITMCAMLGMPLGPLLAGWMLTHFAWGSVFLINGPVVAVSLIGVACFLPESKDPASPRLDWRGALLAAAGLTAVIYAVIEQPDDGWSGPVITALGGGLLLLVACALWLRRAKDPLVDLRLFTNRTFGWGSAAFALVSFAMTGMLFTLTPFLQIVHGADAQRTGAELLPMIGALLVSAAVINNLSARLNIRWTITAGMVICCAGLGVLTRAGAGTGYWVTALALAVFGLGLGLALPLAADSVLATLPPAQTGAGSGLSRALQQIAVALSPAVLGSVLASGYRHGLPATASAAARGSVAGAYATHNRPLIVAAGHAYAHGMALAAMVTIAVLAVGAVLTVLFLPALFLSAGRSASRGKGDGVDGHGDRPADHALLPGDAEAGPVERGGRAEPDQVTVHPRLGDPDRNRLGHPVRGD